MSQESTYLPYTLTLRSPVIASTLSGDPNSATTRPFIPGGAIRGAVAARAAEDELPELVLSGAVRYLHAYPEIAGNRGLPTPASWRCPKHDRDAARDLAAFPGRVSEEHDADDLAELWPEEALGAAGAPFVSPTAGAGARRLWLPRTGRRLHQQRDRVRGRPWKDTRGGQEVARGAIFAYEYLQAEQVFRGAIQVTPPARALVERLRALLLAGPLLLGRSRRAGYGGEARLELGSETRREYENVSGALERDLAAGECFRVQLASAYVGRHPVTGQLDPTAFEHELGERLGVAVKRRRWDFETLGSFNRKWRLEVPQAWAVAAGAVWVVEARRAVARETLRAVEDQGLGERRVEGFGRVLFLEHSESQGTIRLERQPERIPDRPGSPAPWAGAPAAAREQIDFLEARIVLAAARAELGRLAADRARSASRIPSNSLLGRVRTLFRGVGDESRAGEALADLRLWCGEDPDASLRRSARDQLGKCHLRKASLLDWLAGLAPDGGSPDSWRRLIAAVDRASSLTGLAERHHLTTASAAQEILEGHAALLTVHLADTLLATLARRNSETADE